MKELLLPALSAVVVRLNRVEVGLVGSARQSPREDTETDLSGPGVPLRSAEGASRLT